MIGLDALKPYLIVGVGIIWSASLVVVGYWQNHAGRTVERVEWQDRQMGELTKASEEINRLQIEARQTEQARANQLNVIAARYEKEKADVAAKKDFVIAGLRSGGLRLRDPGAPTLQAGTGGTDQTTSCSSERDGRATGELSRTTSEALVALMSEADEVVKQLSECQSVVRTDRLPKGGDPSE